MWQSKKAVVMILSSRRPVSRDSRLLGKEGQSRCPPEVSFLSRHNALQWPWRWPSLPAFTKLATFSIERYLLRKSIQRDYSTWLFIETLDGRAIAGHTSL